MTSTIKQDLQRHRVRLIDPLLRSIAKFWSWWIGELLATLPASAREAIANANKRIVVTLDDTDWVFSEGFLAGRTTIARMPVGTALQADALPGQINTLAFCLPAAKVLRRTLTLPLAAEENLREVLGFEMDRQTPFAAHQVYYDFQVTGRHVPSNSITVEVVVSPKNVVDEYRTALQQADLRPDSITCEDDEGGLLAVNLLPASMRPPRRLSVPRINTLLATACLVLLVVAISLPAMLGRHKVAQLEQELAQAEIVGQSGLELQREVARITKTAKFLTQKKRSSVLVLQVLEEVSRVLPDNTWLLQFEFNEPEVQLQGQSSSAAELIQLLESSPLFRNARFRSPVVQVPRTDKERFHLSVELEIAEAT